MKRILISLSLVILMLAGCQNAAKEVPDGTGYKTETSGTCDDGDNSNDAKQTKVYNDPARSGVDNATRAFSAPASFKDIIDTAVVQVGTHADHIADAFPKSKVTSQFKVTRTETLQYVISTSITASLTSGRGEVRVVARMLDDSGRFVPNSDFQIVYKVDPNQNRINVSMNNLLKATIGNPDSYSGSETGPAAAFTLNPGTYTFLFELNVEAMAKDGSASLSAHSTVDFR